VSSPHIQRACIARAAKISSRPVPAKDVIGGFLGLCRGVNDQLAFVAKYRE
jgi:hypothetical protein